MTDLQDMILDRLVGTRVGVHWPNGPLAIAAEVVGGQKPVKFGQTGDDRGAKAEVARRLGYPVLLCEAIQGANRGLKAEDDRRSLAMTLFGTIPVGAPAPKLSAQAQNRVAARMAIRAHPYICPRPDCPVPGAIADLLEAPTVTRQMAVAAARTRCETAGGTLEEMAYCLTTAGWLTARSTPVQRLVQTAAMALRGFETGKSVHGWCSIRESARLAASERGVAEAVACCVEIARQCQMAV
jgi:hypothetical protein